jgi:hypothetical protein
MARKLCIFCGARVDSVEDVWPKWLLELSKKWPGQWTMAVKRLNKEGTIDSWKQPLPEIRVYAVCQNNCNGGWMSRLENLAKPILIPMIEGQHVTLDTEQQFAIARWTVKCQMVFDVSAGTTEFYTATERHQFMMDQTPLDWTTIWLGHYDGPNIRLFSRHIGFDGKKEKTPHISHILTMAFGHLVIQVMCAKFLGDVDSLYASAVTRGNYDGMLVELFPNPVRWPPCISFDDSDRTLDAFADRFGPKPRTF